MAALVRAAQRIEEGRYESPVVVRGAREFRKLATTLNAMQTGIAERETRIKHLAYHDALTGLPNRAYAEIQLDELLKDDPTTPLAMILVDVRNLPDINATLGHHVGDAALHRSRSAASSEPGTRRSRCAAVRSSVHRGQPAVLTAASAAAC